MYFDNAATLKPLPEAMVEFNTVQERYWANPSAIHTEGQKAQACLERCRQKAASILGCDHTQIFFTPSATVSDNLVMLNKLYQHQHVLVSAIAHAAIYEARNQFSDLVHVMYPEKLGAITWSDIEKEIDDHTGLLSLLHVNNEHGAITDIEHIFSSLQELNTRRDNKILLHVDGVQAALYQDIKQAVLYSDFYVISGHKIGAPRGCSILFIRRPEDVVSTLYGGGQEHGMMPGTENLAAIAATTKALEVRQQQLLSNRTHLDELYSAIASEALKHSVEIINQGDQFQQSHILIKIPDSDTDEVLTYLDLKGFSLSAGSSCQSGSSRVSHVIEYSGLDTSSAYIRMSLSPESNTMDALNCIRSLAAYVNRG